MIKKYLLTLSFCISTFALYAQKEQYVISEGTRVPARVFIAQGCEGTDDIRECGNMKLRTATFKALSDTDIKNIVKNTQKDTILIITRLYFDAEREIDTEASSITIYDAGTTIESNVALKPSLKNIAFSPSEMYRNVRTRFASALYAKVDREKQRISPLYSYKKKKTKKKFAIYSDCEDQPTYETQRKCFSEKISEYINQRFNTKIASDIDLRGKVRIIARFTIAKDGTITDIESRAPHPKLKQEMNQILEKHPRVTPAMTNGKPVAEILTIPIIFTVI